MQILGNFCLLLLLYSVIDFCRKIAKYSLHLQGLFLMDCFTCFKHLNLRADFGCGVLLFGSFKESFKIVVFLFLFGTGLRFFKITWHYIGFLCDFKGKSGGLGKGLSSKCDFDVEFLEKIESCESKLLKLLKTCDEHESSIEIMKKTKNSSGVLNSDQRFCDDVDCKEEIILDSEFEGSIDYVDEKGEAHEWYDEDDEFDVLRLRKMIRFERNKARKACLELEKERVAAATAAEETMAMILRLQNEKSCVEMEANQYRRLAEEKQLHDQEVIRSLQWFLSIHEESLRTMESGDREDQFKGVQESWISSNANFENASNHGLFSSLDLDSSPCVGTCWLVDPHSSSSSEV